MSVLKGFLRFWYELVVGDDWKVAVAVVLALTLTTVSMLTGLLAGVPLVVTGAITLAVLFAASVLVGAGRRG